MVTTGIVRACVPAAGYEIVRKLRKIRNDYSWRRTSWRVLIAGWSQRAREMYAVAVAVFADLARRVRPLDGPWQGSQRLAEQSLKTLRTAATAGRQERLVRRRPLIT